MPRSKTGVKRKQISKEDLEKAVDMVMKKQQSVYGASKEFNISKTTLLRHIQSFKKTGLSSFKYKQNNDTRRIFTDEEEQLLVAYILKAAHLQYGLTLKDVRTLAYQFAKQNKKKCDPSWEDRKLASKDWLRGFRKRYGKQLALRKPEATSLARSTAFNKDNVALFFRNFKTALEKNPGITSFNIWNCDETGISTVHVPPKILASKGLKQVGSMTSAERGTNITMIGAINAGGGFIPPMLIFPRKHFKDHMLKGAPSGTIGGANLSGWSNEDLFYDFFKHFIKFSGASKQNPVILLMDNHQSHISIPTIELAKENGVTLLTFHPHTSHKMQPLDRCVFGPFKAFYNRAMNDWMTTPGNVGKPATIYDVAELVGRAFTLAFTPSNIINGFKVCGLHPLNEDVFEDSEFLPSNVTDRSIQDQEENQSQIDYPIQSNSQSINTESEPLTPGTVTLSPNIVTPEQIRPYPKALPRKQIHRGRPKGKSCILTDTPEKNRIEMEKAKSTLKKMKQSKTVQLPTKSAKKSPYYYSTDSEDEDIDDLFEESGLSEEDFGELEDPDNVNIQIGSFVLVKFAGKKSIKYFIAEIISITDNVYEVQYLKRDPNSQKFKREDPTVYEVDKNDIMFKLPHPILSGGSERQLEKLAFGIDLSNYNLG